MDDILFFIFTSDESPFTSPTKLSVEDEPPLSSLENIKLLDDYSVLYNNLSLIVNIVDG